MTRSTIRRWFLVHKWSSIVSTLFLLMLCVTGLPLIFHDEIDAVSSAGPEAQLAGEPSATQGVPLDAIVAAALAERPGEVPLFIGFSQDSPLITVTTGAAPDAPVEAMTLLNFDRATGRPLGAVEEGGMMHFILDLHTDLLLGLPGMFLLGGMIETLGPVLSVDMASYWTADAAFYELLRDREVATAILAEVGGEAIAAANAKEKGKTIKGLIADCLTGENGRTKRDAWVPRWMLFPPSAYTPRGGVATVAAAERARWIWEAMSGSAAPETTGSE